MEREEWATGAEPTENVTLRTPSKQEPRGLSEAHLHGAGVPWEQPKTPGHGPDSRTAADPPRGGALVQPSTGPCLRWQQGLEGQSKAASRLQHTHGISAEWDALNKAAVIQPGTFCS